MNESVYKLIPEAEKAQHKAPFHKSIYSKTKVKQETRFNKAAGKLENVQVILKPECEQFPIYSTFPSKRPGEHLVRCDEDTDGLARRLFMREAAVMGKPVVDEIDPKIFLKSHEKDSLILLGLTCLCGGNGTCAYCRAHGRMKCTCDGQGTCDYCLACAADAQGRPKYGTEYYSVYDRNVPLRSAVPLQSEKPLMGQFRDKDFVKSNAAEVMNHAPPKADDRPNRGVDRRTFGKVPKYLGKIKDILNQEEAWIQGYHDQQRQCQMEELRRYRRELDPVEKAELLAKLIELQKKKSWKIQSLPFASRNTPSQKMRQGEMEGELKEIDAGVAKLNRDVVFIYKDDDRVHSESYKAAALTEAQLVALRRMGYGPALQTK